MLLFSTILDIDDSMTQDNFIKLVIEWNQGSPHSENIIPNIEWNGERSITFGTDKLWLAIEEYNKENIIAVRYEKIENDGVIWDTDYVMNFNEMRLAIRLDRSYLESALNMNPDFSTPFFIKLLIEHNYLKNDNNIPILDWPITIDNDNINLLINIINGKIDYRMPVVYVSKTYHGEDPVNISLLARRLKGVAHILVQKGAWLNQKLRESCNDQNEYYGAIGIYYPNKTIGHRKFFYRVFEGEDNTLLNKVVRSVISYSNAQMIPTLYTWQGVNNALLLDKYSNQKKQRLEAELEKAKVKDEVEQLWESYADDTEKLHTQIEKLTKANEALTYENQGLKSKLDSIDNIPVLFHGDEEDFFQGEIREIILDAISEQIKNTEPKSRRYDVLCDIISSNENVESLKVKRNEIKNIFKDYRSLSGTMRQRLFELGFSITEDGKHYRLTYYGDSRYHTTISKTASDYREGKNIAATINKSIL